MFAVFASRMSCLGRLLRLNLPLAAVAARTNPHACEVKWTQISAQPIKIGTSYLANQQKQGSGLKISKGLNQQAIAIATTAGSSEGNGSSKNCISIKLPIELRI